MGKNKTARRIVDEIMAEFDGRSGFDAWWDGIDYGIQDEILDELIARVKKVLDG